MVKDGGVSKLTKNLLYINCYVFISLGPDAGGYISYPLDGKFKLHAQANAYIFLSDKYYNHIQLCLTMVKKFSILNLNMKIQWKLILWTFAHCASEPSNTWPHSLLISVFCIYSSCHSFHSEHLFSPLKMCNKNHQSTFRICQGDGQFL
jgi:hypothetical protein